MWDKWKKKIEHFIWKEVDANDDFELQEHLPESHPDVKARIVYQYPNNSSYHIPQMNKQESEIHKPKIDIDIPAFMRKEARQETNPLHEEVASTTVQESTITKKPFKPTDVPSPIYGYQRPKEEITSVPAFMRKQKSEIHKPSAEKQVQNMDVSSNPDKAQQLKQVSHQHNTEPVNIGQEEIVTTEKAEQSVIKTRAEKHKKQRIIPRTEGKRQSIIPYNVMMTPEDRRRQLQRQANENKIDTNHVKKTHISPKIEEQEPKLTVPEQTITENSEIKVDEKDYKIPFHLLNDPVMKSNLQSEWIQEQQQLLEQTLKYFHVRAKVVNATQGPSVTRFEVQPELGVKVSKVKNLSDDLKLNMSARDIRIEAPIPGKNTIGIEVPNPSSTMVSLQEIIGSNEFSNSTSPLTIALGLNIEGAPVVTNIQKMPHGLIAGATGSGKSVCINAILLSLIYKAHHEDVKFMLIDPKMVELAPYNGIPHLVSPVITDVKAATAALKWAVNEMEDRYEKFVEEGVRDIERYNQKMVQQHRSDEKMPFIVIVIDELADLMMVSPQDVEDAISRIAQKARACGIHLLLATQRPSVDVLTGLIKANIPTRIAFSVSSQVDSRTIIDTGGAEKLLGKGDMLFIENGAGKSVRLQGPFVSDEEIERVTSYARSITEPNYLFEQESLLKQFIADEEEDELLQEAIQFIFEQDSASTSLLQRHFKIGYNRAARLMDTLESKGIISGQNGSKPRDVLISKAELEDILS